VIAALLLSLIGPGPEGPPVVVTVEALRVSLAVGERGALEVVASIRKGFRVQANPASRPFLVPAQLELEPTEGLELGPPEYPPGKPYRLRGTTEDLSVYEGEVAIRVPVKARAGLVGGTGDEVVLLGRLRYQACNERVCLRPAEAPVEIRVRCRAGQPAPR
jgi:hypothetical protein